MPSFFLSLTRANTSKLFDQGKSRTKEDQDKLGMTNLRIKKEGFSALKIILTQSRYRHEGKRKQYKYPRN